MAQLDSPATSRRSIQVAENVSEYTPTSLRMGTAQGVMFSHGVMGEPRLYRTQESERSLASVPASGRAGDTATSVRTGTRLALFHSVKSQDGSAVDRLFQSRRGNTTQPAEGPESQRGGEGATGAHWLVGSDDRQSPWIQARCIPCVTENWYYCVIIICLFVLILGIIIWSA